MKRAACIFQTVRCREAVSFQLCVITADMQHLCVCNSLDTLSGRLRTLQCNALQEMWYVNLWQSRVQQSTSSMAFDMLINLDGCSANHPLHVWFATEHQCCQSQHHGASCSASACKACFCVPSNLPSPPQPLSHPAHLSRLTAYATKHMQVVIMHPLLHHFLENAFQLTWQTLLLLCCHMT